ncbi:Uncharacterised protein [Streptococcus suis]|uniref:Uncharacterized protein n=1 Tax=Streptococcus suis TaxID=1307 RepID=A0A0Z8UCC5_STRSU|nr:Uncharacterised protein [Streptococcus suis]
MIKKNYHSQRLMVTEKKLSVLKRYAFFILYQLSKCMNSELVAIFLMIIRKR